MGGCYILTLIKVWALVDIRPDIIAGLLSDLDYNVNVISESKGYYEIKTNPDLTNSHKTSLQKAIDAVGFGIIV